MTKHSNDPRDGLVGRETDSTRKRVLLTLAVVFLSGGFWLALAIVEGWVW